MRTKFICGWCKKEIKPSNKWVAYSSETVNLNSNFLCSKECIQEAFDLNYFRAKDLQEQFGDD
jgi:hypothetical protein